MARKRGDASSEVTSGVSHRLTPMTIAALVLLVLTIVLVGIELTLPWWASFRDGEMTSWYLGSSCTAGSCTGYTETALANTFGLTYAVVLGSLAGYVAALGLFVGSLSRPRIGIASVALESIGSALVAVAPAYLYFSLPGALTSSGFPVPVAGFFGSYTQPGILGATYSWTGAAGWFLAWVVLPISVLATAAAHAAAKHHVVVEQALESLTSLEAHTIDDIGTEPGVEGVIPERFCPLCGLRYPATEEFCSKDSAPLKDVVP